jgi:succinate dehydrogenase / fumarate reductase iron-sulfur subunit
MKKLLDVLRRENADAPAYHQVFAYESDDENATVATALREINARATIVDASGEAAAPIRWECSCLQKKCGSCAMVIEGVPQVACDARLSSFKGETVHLEPLRKFPVIADLVVDRKVMYQNLHELEAWLEHEVELPTRRSEIAYEASRCLECGCCLEVCPNFAPGRGFAGMAGMAPMTRLLSEATREQRKDLAAAYREHVFGGCGKSLACRNICPAELPIDKLMARSNAAAVWSRF